MKNVCKKIAAVIFWIAIGFAFIGVFEFIALSAIAKQQQIQEKQRLDNSKTIIHQKESP